MKSEAINGLARVVLVLVLLSGLAARLVWGAMQGAELDTALGDQREYLEVGRNLLAGEGLYFYDHRFEANAYAFRMPGYPALVAAHGGSVRAVRLGQAVVDTLTVLGVYLLARRFLVDGWTGEDEALAAGGGRRMREWATVFAAGLAAFNPLMVHFTTLILTETVFIAMVTWGMVLLVYRRWYVWGGLLLALSILVRPSGMGLAVVLGVTGVLANYAMGWAYQARSAERPRGSVPVAAGMLLLTGLVVLPWTVRNRQVVGEWVFTTTNEGITRYDGFHPDATGGSDQTFVEQMPWLRGMNEVQRSRYLARQANEFIRENPRRAMELAVIKTGRTWSPVPLSAEYGSVRNRVILAVYAVPLYLLALLGLWNWRAHWAAKAFLLAPAVYFTLVHAASVGSIRYRVPAEVGLMVLAGAGVVVLMGWWGSVRAGRRVE